MPKRLFRIISAALAITFPAFAQNGLAQGGVLRPSGGSPGGGDTAVQVNHPAGTFYGDSTNFQYIPSTSAPSAPVVATHGATGSTTYAYKTAFRFPSGTSAASSATTITNGNAVLDGTNYNVITAPACSVSNEQADIYISTVGGNVTTSGWLATVACGSTYNHQGSNGTLAIPSADTTAGLFLSPTRYANMQGRNAMGDLGAPDTDYIGFHQPALLSLHGLIAEAFKPYDADLMESGATSGISDGVQFLNTGMDATISVTGGWNLSTTVGPGSTTPFQYAGGISSILDIEENITNDVFGSSNVLYVQAAATVGGTVYQEYFYNVTTGGAATIPTWMVIWSQDLGANSAINKYYTWFDSQGVRRVREDATFDSVGQAIEALYNPQFAKYTPGAADYERVVLGQWNANVAEIGTEKGGTGTLRSLRLIGNTVQVNPLASATDKLPVCRHADGTLYNGTNTVGVLACP